MAWLHGQLDGQRSLIAVALSMWLSTLAAPLLPYVASSTHCTELFRNQCLLAGSASGAKAEPGAPCATVPPALQSPMLARQASDNKRCQDALPSLCKWLSIRIHILLAQTHASCGDISEAKALVFDLSTQLKLLLPQATLSRPAIAMSSAGPPQPADSGDDVALLLAFAESECRSDPDEIDSGTTSAAARSRAAARKDLDLLLLIDKSDVLMVHAKIMLSLLNEQQVALTCFQMVISMLEASCGNDRSRSPMLATVSPFSAKHAAVRLFR